MSLSEKVVGGSFILQGRRLVATTGNVTVRVPSPQWLCQLCQVFDAHDAILLFAVNFVQRWWW